MTNEDCYKLMLNLLSAAELYIQFSLINEDTDRALTTEFKNSVHIPMCIKAHLIIT